MTIYASPFTSPHSHMEMIDAWLNTLAIANSCFNSLICRDWPRQWGDMILITHELGARNLRASQISQADEWAIRLTR